MNLRHCVIYGSTTIEFRLERRERSTLAITVEPSAEVVVVAPLDTSLGDIEARLRKRGRWIIRQQQFFGQFTPRTPPRRYVPGETHLYLGRQYRLRVEPGDRRRARLVRGFILVSGVTFDDSSGIERLVSAWYRERAEAQFRKRLEINRARFADPGSVLPTSLRIQRMSARWGSMSASGRLLLHPDLVRAPVDAIDYVITHELCHLKVPNHSRAFYELQERVLPDWEVRKLRLERIMA
ncbi:MAG: M48 family metallopeptidase [Microbacteriaceae bacterium]